MSAKIIDIKKDNLENHLSDRLGYPVIIDKFKVLELDQTTLTSKLFSRWIFVKMEVGDFGTVETQLIKANDIYAEPEKIWEENDKNFKWDIKSLISYIKDLGDI